MVLRITQPLGAVIHMRVLHKAGFSKTLLSLAAVGLSGCVSTLIDTSSLGTADSTETASTYSLQAISAADRDRWQTASQGSRLIPMAWFLALQRTDNGRLLSSPESLSEFGFLYENDSDTLPIGLALDQQKDVHFDVTRLRWYEGQGGTTNANAEPWAGLTCSACHTSEITYRGERMLIAGGPAPFDFQSFISSVDAAVHATLANAQRFQLFAGRVLKQRNNATNRKMLRSALKQFAQWQSETALLDHTSSKYGPGRVDAFGRLGNKVAKFAQVGPLLGHEPDAPVSYPHLWNSHLQKRVQWNGSAENFSVRGGDRLTADLGALTRNSGEVIGVFADVKFRWKEKDQRYSRATISSLNVPNLKALEKTATRFDPPAWPSQFPQLSQAKRARGEELYMQHCADCHLPADTNAMRGGSERMVTFMEARNKNRTDIWAACNFYAAEVPTGKMEDLRSIVVVGERLGPVAPAAQMVDTIVISTLLGKVKDISLELPAQLIKLALSGDLARVGSTEVRTTNTDTSTNDGRSKQQRCLEDNHQDLAYKARPLDGIWATAPYLHNGSVPTLYDLLLPSSKRPASFALGSREYDPIKVGFSQNGPLSVPRFIFKARTADASPVRGNGNQGHEYGTRNLSEKQRWELVEYLKGL